EPRVEDGYVTIYYTPDPGINGGPDDELKFGVDGYGPVHGNETYDLFRFPITFRPFAMRATGDSITAGWGYLGNGDPPQGNDQHFDAIALFRCQPTDSLTNRCSSTS